MSEPAASPELGQLRMLIGEWEGSGVGSWAGGAPFRYEEHCSFRHTGKPHLVYRQRTRAVDDGRPLHGESGYLRACGGNDVELVLAHPIGVAEVEVGAWDGATLRLRTHSVQIAPSAKRVTMLERDMDVEGDVLHYVLRMSTDGTAAVQHLEATLRRLG
ncbi:MAG: FABP family protein [Candidatus Dormibacteraeota bacterium]|nr:FABP family protein [Candidatus Dormibacteraeota bacterium]